MQFPLSRPALLSLPSASRELFQGRAPWPAGEGLDANGALKSSTVRWSASESNWERASAKAGLFEDAVDAGLVLRQNLSMTTGELTTFMALTSRHSIRQKSQQWR
jgi:hypothetical protein